MQVAWVFGRMEHVDQLDQLDHVDHAWSAGTCKLHEFLDEWSMLTMLAKFCEGGWSAGSWPYLLMLHAGKWRFWIENPVVLIFPIPAHGPWSLGGLGVVRGRLNGGCVRVGGCAGEGGDGGVRCGHGRPGVCLGIVRVLVGVSTLIFTILSKLSEVVGVGRRRRRLKPAASPSPRPPRCVRRFI